ncbi:DUF7289 family protein [Halopenitus persicus]|uniref:DUF7289 family protein n=1 Tax=Halopenitus persicus TaxID=1048396 RepID=UPI000BBA6458|nr:hypothetical protein [Halopenitus persicus]
MLDVGGIRGGEKTDRAATAPIGVVLLIGITLVGTLAVVTFGSTAIADIQQTADVERSEHVMTKFASQASLVALGETETQTMATGDSAGTMTVVEDAGRMQVWHVNASGAGAAERLADGSLGSVTYRNGDDTVAFQGGGVWRTDGDAARMVSPPQFHYRGATLTLPIVSVTAGETVASGGPSRVRLTDNGTTRVFPDPNDPDSTNPVTNGSVVVAVESDYHDGWREYFERRTTGSVVSPADLPADVTDDVDTSRTVFLELESIGGGGVFEWPGDGGSVPVRGLAGEGALEDFSTELSISNPNNAWVSFHAENGDRRFEALLEFDNGQGAGTPVCEATFDTHILYGNGTDTHHWRLLDSTGTETGNEFADCSGDGDLTVDFASTEEFTYDTGTGDVEDAVYDWENVNDTATIVGTDGNDVSRDDGQSIAVVEPVSYYAAQLGPTFDLEVEYATGGEGQGNQLDPGSSSLTLRYDASGEGRYITYLHVTENGVIVEFA